MKLIRFGEYGKEKPGVIVDDNWFDVSSYIEDYNEHFFEQDGLSRIKKIITENKDSLPILNKNTRLGSSVARPSKIICIGLNYEDHAKETGAASCQRNRCCHTERANHLF